MINKVNNNQISDILREVPVKQAGSVGQSSKKADASLQVSYETVIEKAQEMPAEDIQAVARARQMLLSGELDSPETIRQTAEKIADYGI